MADTEINVIVEEFDVDAFDFPDEEAQVDPAADAFAPYRLAPSGLYLARGGYYERDKGIKKKTLPADPKRGKEERQFLAATVDFVIVRPFEDRLSYLDPLDYENQHVFFRTDSFKRRDNGASKFVAVLQCALPDLQGGVMRDSDVARTLDQVLRQGFEGVIEVDWRGYNPNTKRSRSGMSSFPLDPADPQKKRRIARYRDQDGTVVDGQLEIVKLVSAAALQAAGA